MRRKIAFLLAAVLSFSLAACSADNSASSPKTDAPTDSQTEAPVAEENGTPISGESQSTGSRMKKRMLIVYYSVSNGNTERIAQWLQKATGADIARIETVKPYTGS